MRRAKITHMWGEWPYYYVSSRWACRDETDRSAYDEFCRSGGEAVQMGKVCVEPAEVGPKEPRDPEPAYNLRCPKCGPVETVKAWTSQKFEVYRDGTMDPIDEPICPTEDSDPENTECPLCGHTGPFSAFLEE